MATAGDTESSKDLAQEEDYVKRLKFSAASYKGKYTLARKALEAALSSKVTDHAIIKQRYESLLSCFNNYKPNFVRYLSKVEDPATLEKERQILIALEDEFNKLSERTRDWVVQTEPSAKKKTAHEVDDAFDRRSVRSGSNYSSDSKRIGEIRMEQLKRRQHLDRERREVEERKREAHAKMREEEQRLEELRQQRRLQDELDQEELLEVEEAKSVISVKYSNLVPMQYNYAPPPLVSSAIPRTNYFVNYGRPDREDVNRLDPEATEFEPEHTENRTGGGNQTITPESLLDTLMQFIETVRTPQELPKIEVPIFSGDPMDYTLFIHTFDAYVDARVKDPNLKLNYLIQHCIGAPKRAIQSYILLGGNAGYLAARRELYDRFGRPHSIIDAQINSLIYGPQIPPNDGQALLELASAMRRCELTLCHLKFSSNIYNSRNILQIMWRLPKSLQHRWSDAANAIFECGREPTFKEFTNFVDRSAKAATNYYGKNIGNKSTNKPRVFTTIDEGSNSNNNNINDNDTSGVDSTDTCPYCKSEHKLYTCSKFKELTMRDRFEFVRNSRLCFNCFKTGHAARNCWDKRRCNVNNCKGRHNSLLHRNGQQGNNTHTQSKPTVTQERDEQNCNFNNCVNTMTGKVLLQVVPVKLQHDGKVVYTNALLDTGSQVTLCREDILQRLACIGQPEGINITTVNGKSTAYSLYNNTIRVSSMKSDSDFLDVSRVCGVKSLPNLNDASLKSVNEISSWPHLTSIDFPPLNSGGVGLLVGSDVPEAFWVSEQTPFRRGEPYASRGVLGWSLLGPCAARNDSDVNLFLVEDDLQLKLERFWKTDFPPECESTRAMSKQDRKALEILQSNKQLVDGHFSFPLPFKCDHGSLINNKPLAVIRLSHLKRRLGKDSCLLQKYTTAMEGYIADGYAERVARSSLEESRYFIPHHAVTHPRKGKLRVVFDCAASWKGMSLNDSLYSGPDINNNIIGVLLRFRRHRIALTSDISAMFHQVKVLEDHRKFLSFLWYPNGDLSVDPEVYQMTVHLFGAKSSPFCATFALHECVKDFGSKFSHLTCSTILEDFYVDDCLTSVDDEATAIQLREELCGLLKLAGFHLTKWMSSSKLVLSSIPDEMKVPQAQCIDLDKDALPTDSALGLKWNVENDHLIISSRKVAESNTRRGLLSTLASVYDPLGIVAPFCLKPKLLVQDLCRRRYDWDDRIEESDQKLWNAWVSDLPLLESLNVPRWIQTDIDCNVERRELHHFSDASSVAYAAVSYVRVVLKSGEMDCRFLIGKSRLAPLKNVTVPRLELSAAVLSTKLHSVIMKEMRLKFDSVTFWSDSSIVLQNISNETKRFKVFVANRLNKIHSVSSPEQWRHVDGVLNPADEGTRGIDAEKMVHNGKWINGPNFLRKDESCWPTKSFQRNEVVETLIESPLIEVSVNCTNSSLSPMRRFVNHYSDYGRLLRATSWLILFIRFLKSDKSFNPVKITAGDIKQSERCLVKFVQGEHFPNADKDKGIHRKLSPFLHEGLLRVGGRLSRASLKFEAKHPIILPSRCHFTTLIIRNAHQKHGHIGPHHTWTLLRESYWIIRGGVEIRHEIGHCIKCKKRNARPCTQFMADLPSCRVSGNKPPFHETGLDFFGPILVKNARSEVKMYGCLFSCMSCRAVHLEISDSLNVTSFLNALRRFIGRRGTPKSIWCDNGTNFVGGKLALDRSFKQLLDEPKWSSWRSYLAEKQIDWNFIPPSASHMGGSWERMVRSVKSILFSLLNEQMVNRDTLHTLLVEVEAILNSRPLTPLSIDPRDGLPLTPNQLLRLDTDVGFPPGIFDKADSYSKNRWKQCQYLADQFWSQWSRRYLPLLLPRQKWRKENRNVSVDDLVLVIDDRIPRRTWPVGKVVQVYPDGMGLVRQIDVKYRGAVHRRPITKICVLKKCDDI